MGEPENWRSDVTSLAERAQDERLHGSLERAVSLINEAFDLADRSGDPENVAFVAVLLVAADIALELHEYDSAIPLYNRAWGITAKLTEGSAKDPQELLVRTYLGLARCEAGRGNRHRAIHLYVLCLQEVTRPEWFRAMVERELAELDEDH